MRGVLAGVRHHADQSSMVVIECKLVLCKILQVIAARKGPTAIARGGTAIASGAHSIAPAAHDYSPGAHALTEAPRHALWLVHCSSARRIPAQAAGSRVWCAPPR